MIKDETTLNVILETVSKFVKERLIPIEEACAENDQIPEEVVDQIRELGLFGLSIPEEYGIRDTTIITIKIFRVCSVAYKKVSTVYGGILKGHFCGIF